MLCSEAKKEVKVWRERGQRERRWKVGRREEERGGEWEEGEAKENGR